MRNTPLGTGLSCRPIQTFALKSSFFLFFFFSYFLTRAQTQVQWNQTGNNIYNPNSGNVGIGTQTPNAKLEVDGNLLFLPTSTGQMYIVNGTTVDYNKAGIRCNTGGIVFNSSGPPAPATPGKLFLNRDVNADTWIESTPDNGATSIEIATFKANGNVGINTTTPRTKLDVNGTFYMNRPAAMGDAESTLGIPAGSYLGIAPSDMSAANPGYVLFLFPDHNSFRIGTNYDGHLGSPVVNGSARANQVVVNTTGADFVFEPGYRLPKLEEIETFIRKEHHLPGIAPATAMQKEGMDVGDSQTRLLAKVEELTLYVIGQDKEIKRLRQENQELQDIKARLARLEQYISNNGSH